MKGALLAALLVYCLPASAIERIRLRAAEVQAAGTVVRDIDATLAIVSTSRSTLTATTGPVTLPAAVAAQTGALRRIELQCRDPLIREPLFACPALRIALHTERWPALTVQARVQYDASRMALQVSGTAPGIPGISPAFTASATGERWQVRADIPETTVDAWAKLLEPWVSLPKDLGFVGKLKVAVQAQGVGAAMQAQADVALADGGFQNEDYTWIGEKLALTARVKASLEDGADQPVRLEMEIAGEKGQALAGPVLLDFNLNPLRATARGTWSAQRLHIESLSSTQKDLAQATGSADILLAPFRIIAANLEVSELSFPAAYASYLQLSLATTPFNQLKTTGSATLRLRIADNLPVALDATVKDLTLSDADRKLEVTGINSAVHWAAGDAAPEMPSWLAWENSRGWGIEGAKTRLDFAVHDRDFRLLEAALLPFFDGALRINRFAVQNIAQPDMAGEFDAVIDPISLAPVARALGLPEFAGTLSGRIPGLTFRDGALTLQGDVEADVFGGHLVARNLGVRDLFSDWPKMHADITARNLDLDLITRVFKFGNMTGKLDVDLLGLETFGLTPTSFDLRIATPRGDRSRHRISQRAVENLSNIGGGGGGVASALQSGFLKFFEEFRYDRIGLACKLRNDVCQMSGAGPAREGTGFYIVKGSGLPRIDIIGNNARVDWPVFMAQVVNALKNPGEITFN
jgi:hypothetical protein